MKLTLLIFALSCISYAHSDKILGVFTSAGPSHYFLAKTLLRGLAEKGHDITIISPFEEKIPPKNGTWRNIVLTGALEEMEKAHQNKKMSMYDRVDSNPAISAFFFAKMVSAHTTKAMENENVQKLIHSGEIFDVVIVEQFMNDAQKAFSTLFKAPLVTFSTVGANIWVNEISGNPAPPSYISDVLLAYPSNMTYWQRVKNFAMLLYTRALLNFYIYPTQNAIIQKYIPNPPAIEDVLYNSSIVLLNGHWSFSQAVPLVPNMINIGGFHITATKKLPSDLQHFMDDAKDGVIYLSFGSNLRISKLPVEKREALINAFSKLKQKVLLKWEEDTLPNHPQNVKIAKWFPQQEVLAHPNIKLFITHGGLLSTTETVHHGVPILTIPILADQKLNAMSAVNNGIGLTLPFPEITEESLLANINELITNRKYSNNVKQRSVILHDRIVHPLDEAIYWVEFVLRHRGAPHLKVAGLDLPWYKYHSIDVIGLFVVLILICNIMLKLFIVNVFKMYAKSKELKSGAKTKND